MSAEKSIFIGFPVTPEFKRLLDLAAKQDQRSKTNLLEKLLVDHCRIRGLLPSDLPCATVPPGTAHLPRTR